MIFSWSPLHYAAYFGHIHTVDFFVKLGLDINCQNSEFKKWFICLLLFIIQLKKAMLIL